jgi:hypothetical protein
MVSMVSMVFLVMFLRNLVGRLHLRDSMGSDSMGRDSMGRDSVGRDKREDVNNFIVLVQLIGGLCISGDRRQAESFPERVGEGQDPLPKHHPTAGTADTGHGVVCCGNTGGNIGGCMPEADIVTHVLATGNDDNPERIGKRLLANEAHAGQYERKDR